MHPIFLYAAAGAHCDENVVAVRRSDSARGGRPQREWCHRSTARAHRSVVRGGRVRRSIRSGRWRRVVSVSVYICVYIYIYRERVRERDY